MNKDLAIFQQNGTCYGAREQSSIVWCRIPDQGLKKMTGKKMAAANKPGRNPRIICLHYELNKRVIPNLNVMFESRTEINPSQIMTKIL